MSRTVTPENIRDFEVWLQKAGKVNDATVEKYVSTMDKLVEYLNGREMTQEAVEGFKAWLVEEKHYKKSSANLYLYSLANFCRAMEWDNIDIPTYVLEPRHFNSGDKYISRPDYQRLVTTALYLEDYRLAMLIQTLCHMDLRFSEIGQMSVEAVQAGYVEVTRRHHIRQMEIPEYLQESLLFYIQQEGMESGVVFRTSGGNVVNRSNIWKDVKHLCMEAKLEPERVTLLKLKMPRMHDYYPFYPLAGHSPSQKVLTCKNAAWGDKHENSHDWT